MRSPAQKREYQSEVQPVLAQQMLMRDQNSISMRDAVANLKNACEREHENSSQVSSIIEHFKVDTEIRQSGSLASMLLQSQNYLKHNCLVDLLADYNLRVNQILESLDNIKMTFEHLQSDEDLLQVMRQDMKTLKQEELQERLVKIESEEMRLRFEQVHKTMKEAEMISNLEDLKKFFESHYLIIAESAFTDCMNLKPLENNQTVFLTIFDQSYGCIKLQVSNLNNVFEILCFMRIKQPSSI